MKGAESIHMCLHTNLMAPWTRGFRKNLENRLVTSSISDALRANASTFVRHLTVLLLTNRYPVALLFFPSVKDNKKSAEHIMMTLVLYFTSSWMELQTGVTKWRWPNLGSQLQKTDWVKHNYIGQKLKAHI